MGCSDCHSRGAAGIIGITRREKGNVLPGVAIATALMPPLCTAGYGIATGSLRFFLGAMLLFLFNTWFILLTTLIGLKLMKVPPHAQPSPAKERSIRRRIMCTTIIFIIIGLVAGGYMVKRSLLDNEPLFENTETAVNMETIVNRLQEVWPEVTSCDMNESLQWLSETDSIRTVRTASVLLSEPLPTDSQASLESYLKADASVDTVVFS